jgi:hypothetical protein
MPRLEDQESAGSDLIWWVAPGSFRSGCWFKACGACAMLALIVVFLYHAWWWFVLLAVVGFVAYCVGESYAGDESRERRRKRPPHGL